MTALQAYRYYMALKLHFTTDSFDVFKNPRVKCSQKTFEGRNDRYLFEKLSYKYNTDRDLIQYIASNFIYGHNEVVYDEEESSNCYTKWIKHKESITKLFEDDLSKILLYAQRNKLSKDDLLNGNPPIILQLYIGNHISIESISILDDTLNLIDNWKDNIMSNFWESDIRRIAKSKRFIKYNKSRIQPIVENFLEELEEL